MATQSWESMVRQADPDFDKPTIGYQFSNGRKFNHDRQPYRDAAVAVHYDAGRSYDRGATYS